MSSHKDNRKYFIENEYSKYWINARKGKYKLNSYDLALINTLKNISSSKVLEIGIGTGEGIAESFLDKDLYGIDISSKLVDECKRLFPDINVSVADAEDLHFENKKFDLSYCVHSTWYFPNLNQAISEMIRVTKPNGHVCFDIQNILNERIKNNLSKHIFENTKFLGKLYKLLKNLIKYITKRGQAEWGYSVYEIPSNPISIINFLKKQDVKSIKTYALNQKEDALLDELEFREINSNFENYPRILFIIKI